MEQSGPDIEVSNKAGRLFRVDWRAAAIILGVVYVFGTMSGMVFPQWMPWETKNDYVHDSAAITLRYDDEIAALRARQDVDAENSKTTLQTMQNLQRSVEDLNGQLRELQGRIDQMNNPQHLKVR